ncbi:MAG: SpoIIE family protein phosphatase [Synechococcus sp. ELA057]
MAKQRGQLSIRTSFSLITFINIAVISYLIATSWHAVNGNNYQQGGMVVFGLTVLLGVLAAISFFIIERRVVDPLIHLVKQINTIQHQKSDSLLTASQIEDEISKLARAFNQLLLEMRRAHQELDIGNQQLRKANKQIEDSIRYAGLLQKSILPDRQLSDIFADQYFVLWEPKDIVGGDYYLFHREQNVCLTGVADCAGHGVPGAMMTMMARAGVDRSIQEVGISSPAQLLRSLDSTLRSLVIDDQQSRSIATSMDMGLVVLDFENRRLRFAGARISLYWSDGQAIDWISGENRAICDRRKGNYIDHDLELLPGFTYYLTTDGYLDQSGGEYGYAIGSQRFIEWLTENARKPLADQRQAFSESLARFRGNHPQRDDITILSFRFD